MQRILSLALLSFLPCLPVQAQLSSNKLLTLGTNNVLRPPETNFFDTNFVALTNALTRGGFTSGGGGAASATNFPTLNVTNSATIGGEIKSTNLFGGTGVMQEWDAGAVDSDLFNFNFGGLTYWQISPSAANLQFIDADAGAGMGVQMQLNAGGLVQFPGSVAIGTNLTVGTNALIGGTNFANYSVISNSLTIDGITVAVGGLRSTNFVNYNSGGPLSTEMTGSTYAQEWFDGASAVAGVNYGGGYDILGSGGLTLQGSGVISLHNSIFAGSNIFDSYTNFAAYAVISNAFSSDGARIVSSGNGNLNISAGDDAGQAALNVSGNGSGGDVLDLSPGSSGDVLSYSAGGVLGNGNWAIFNAGLGDFRSLLTATGETNDGPMVINGPLIVNGGSITLTNSPSVVPTGLTTTNTATNSFFTGAFGPIFSSGTAGVMVVTNSWPYQPGSGTNEQVFVQFSPLATYSASASYNAVTVPIAILCTNYGGTNGSVLTAPGGGLGSSGTSYATHTGVVTGGTGWSIWVTNLSSALRISGFITEINQ